MTPDQSLFAELRLLITEAVEGSATTEQMARLNEILAGSKKARKYYFEFIDIQTLTEHVCSEKLVFNKAEEGTQDELRDHQMLLDALAQEEKQADTIRIEKAEQPLEKIIVHRMDVVKNSWKINKSSIVSIVIAAAAMLLLVLFLRYAPPAPGVQVATLIDSVDAKWADVDASVEPGARLVTSYAPMLLTEGVAQLLFDNNAEVVIEGPAKFEIMATDQIQLSYGRLFAKVPKEAIGFTVRCETTKVIDLGTEFGVSADLRGGMELHVLKGKTLLFAGDNDGVVSTEVKAGTARKVSPEMTISDIPCNHRIFARAINSVTHTIWRGETMVDLADIVGGGNGFGTGQACVGIDPATGKLSPVLTKEGREQKTYRYCPVPENPCIDGVFVPLGGKTPTVVTSQGNVFKECPDTDGGYWIEITNRPITSMYATAEENQEFQLARLNGIPYGTPQRPAIMLHANTGITFDLNAIRSMNPGRPIRCFTSLCGLSDTLTGTSLWDEANAVLWILIDGQTRQMIPLDMSDQKDAYVNVNINENDRFLTLVATDGGNTKNGDWTVFGDPVLVLDQAN